MLQHEWVLLLSGVASLIFGFFVLAAPAAGALAIVVWVAAYALIFGILLIAFGLRLRGVNRRQIHPAAPLSPA